jgi:hypothetical protein
MATANDRRDAAVRPPGIKYPWSDWQNGKWWKITAGEDFSVTIKAMRDQLHTRAKAKDVKVRTHTDKVSNITFVFQLPGETDEAFDKRVAETS